MTNEQNQRAGPILCLINHTKNDSGTFVENLSSS